MNNLVFYFWNDIGAQYDTHEGWIKPTSSSSVNYFLSLASLGASI